MTLCPFLKRRGGRVIFGGTLVRVVPAQHVSKLTIKELSTQLWQINSLALLTVQRVPATCFCEFDVVSTGQDQLRPYTYRTSGYRQVGNSAAAIPIGEYNRMLFERMHSEECWENQLYVGRSVNNLDVPETYRKVAEAVWRGRLEEPVTRVHSELLRGLGRLRDWELLRAAVLFSSKDQLEIKMLQCMLHVPHLSGNDRQEFPDNWQFIGNVTKLLSISECFLRESLPFGGGIEGDCNERINDPQYLPLATREALANALQNNGCPIGGDWVGESVFDACSEATCSSSLYFGLAPEKLLTPNKPCPRDPMNARAFCRRRILEEWGKQNAEDGGPGKQSGN